MPFAPAANPDLAGQYLYGAITRAGEQIGAGVEGLISGLQAKSKERKLYLGIADQLLKSGDLSEVDHAALQNLDTDQIKGKIAGLQTVAQLKKLRDEGLLTDAHIKTLNLALKVKENEEAALQRFNELFRQRQALSTSGTGAASVAGALAQPDTFALGAASRVAATQPIPRPPRMGAEDVFGLAAQAGMKIAPEEAAKAFERFGTPGTVTDIPNQPYSFAWETKSSGVPLPKRPPGGNVRVEPSAVPGIAIAIDEMGKTHFVKTSADDLGVAGKGQADQMRLELASLDADIAAAQTRLRKEPGGVQRVKKGTTQISTDYFGTEDLPLQNYVDRLLARRTATAMQLQSLRESARQSPAALVAPAGKPPTPIRWRFNEQTGQLEPLQ